MGGFLKKLIERLQQPVEVNAGRLGAIALLLGVLLFLFMVLIYPLISLESEYQEMLDRQRFKLRQAKQVLSLREPLNQRLENIKALNRSNETLLATTTAPLASADLQTRIKQVVSEAGGELSSTQVIPEKNEENVVRLGVKVRINGSTPILRNVLHAFESGKPALFIDNLNVRPIRVPINPREKGSVAEDKLSIDFDVIGYMQAP
jgi:general secretion pathway protein M